MKGRVIWFYGLSGSGKTTLANELEKYLRENTDLKIQRLDGDNVREELTRDLGFSLEDRFEHIRRVAFVANLLSNHGITVICSFITPLKAIRIYLKKIFKDRLFLVYCNCTLEECIERDVKGIYEKALNGKIKNMSGLTQEFDYSYSPELGTIIVSTTYNSIEESLKSLLKRLYND